MSSDRIEDQIARWRDERPDEVAVAESLGFLRLLCEAEESLRRLRRKDRGLLCRMAGNTAEEIRAGLGRVLGVHEAAKADSPLWTSPAGRDEPYAHLEVPDNLDEIVAQVAEESREHIAERVRSYEAGLQRAPREEPSPVVEPPTLTREELAELRRLWDEWEAGDPVSLSPLQKAAFGAFVPLLAMAERCVEMEAERDKWERRAKERRDHALKCATDAKYLERERDEARAALRRYGRHADDCRISMPANNYEIASGFGKCTCGLSAAIGDE